MKTMVAIIAGALLLGATAATSIDTRTPAQRRYNSTTVVHQVIPGKGVGPVLLGLTKDEVEAMDLRFNLQDPLYIDGKLVGFSTNTGGTVALGTAMIGLPITRAIERQVKLACSGEKPLFFKGDKYQKGVYAQWAVFPHCGLGIRFIVIPQGGGKVSFGLQAWAVFAPNDPTYIKWIIENAVDRSGQRL